MPFSQSNEESSNMTASGMRVVTAANIENNELLRSVLDVALQRIRSGNTQFQNAVLTRAHIRIVGKNKMVA